MKFLYVRVLFICIGHMMLLAGCNNTSINPPEIEEIKPASAPIDTEITIVGSNFGDDAIHNRITINGYVCPVLQVWTDSILIKAVPGVSSGPVTLKVNQLGAISHQDFTLIPHEIDTISPHTASVGETLYFSGRYYCKISDSVKVKVDFDSLNQYLFRVHDYQLKGDSVKFSADIPVGLTLDSGRISIRIGAITVTDKYYLKIVSK